MTDPQKTIVVRERTPADVPAAAAALVEVHQTDGYPVEGVADPTRWITATGQIRAWVAQLDTRIVGHVAISEPQHDDAAAQLWAAQPNSADRPIAVLGRLFVLRTARGHAIGHRLVEVPDHILHPGVGPDIFRAAPARAIERIVFGRDDLGEGLVYVCFVSGLLRIGLMTFEVMQ